LKRFRELKKVEKHCSIVWIPSVPLELIKIKMRRI